MAPPSSPSKSPQPARVALLLRRLFALASLLWLVLDGHGGEEPTPSASFSAALGPPCWWSDANQQPLTPPGPAQQLPSKPFAGQATPPCGGRPDYVRPVNGGCWKLLAAVPPCPDDTYWHTDGRCYEPVRAAKRLPTSAGP